MLLSVSKNAGTAERGTAITRALASSASRYERGGSYIYACGMIMEAHGKLVEKDTDQCIRAEIYCQIVTFTWYQRSEILCVLMVQVNPEATYKGLVLMRSTHPHRPGRFEPTSQYVPT